MLPFVLSTTPEINKKISSLISSAKRFDIEKYKLEESLLIMTKSSSSEDCYNAYVALATLSFFYDKDIDKAIKFINSTRYLCYEFPKTYITAAYFNLLKGENNSAKNYLSRAITYKLDESDIMRIVDPIVNLNDKETYQKFLEKHIGFKDSMWYKIIETEYKKDLTI